MKTFERIPERVRAFQITQGHIDGSEALPEEVALFFGSTDDARQHVGRWCVRENDHWSFYSDADFRAKYRATSESESESTNA